MIWEEVSVQGKLSLRQPLDFPVLLLQANKLIGLRLSQRSPG